MFYDFWGEGLKYCYIMLYGEAGCPEIGIYVLCNMWTMPDVIVVCVQER